MEHLLPDPDARPRCAVYAADLGFDPVGTAIRADQLFLLETPQPWPKPVRDHPWLRGMMDVVGALRVPSRLLACVAEGAPERLYRFRRVGAGVERTVFPRERDLADQLMRLGDPADATPPLEPAAPAATVLVCTQGSHDVCCGSDGERFATQLAARLPHVEVLRVSHTGGHRFAPTGMTLPDGRMWAHMDDALVDAVLNRTGDPALIAARCRGWWGAERGFAQAAERALFARRGWAWEAEERTVEVREHDTGGATCRVSSPAGVWTVQVSVGREVPAISCRVPGGLPATPAPEYTAVLASD